MALKCDPSIPDTIRTGLSFKVTVNEKGLADVTVKASRKKKLWLKLKMRGIPCECENSLRLVYP